MCRRPMTSPAAAVGPRTRTARAPLLARMSCAWQRSFTASLPGTAAADSPAGEHCMTHTLLQVPVSAASPLMLGVFTVATPAERGLAELWRGAL